MLGLVHHVLPAEPQDQPAHRHQIVVAICVSPQRGSSAVPCEGVGLRDDPQPLVDEVWTVPADAHLRHQVEAIDVNSDRSQNGFERIGSKAARGRHYTSDARSAAALRMPETGQGGQFAGAQRGIGNRQGLIKRQQAAAHLQGLPARGRVAIDVGGIEVDPPRLYLGATLWFQPPMSWIADLRELGHALDLPSMSQCCTRQAEHTVGGMREANPVTDVAECVASSSGPEDQA